MADEKSVVVLFVDVRGFTQWSESVEVFANLDLFISGFTELLHRTFAGYSISPLGDGAMLVREVPENPSSAITRRLLQDILKLVQAVDTGFARHCTQFSHQVGHATELKLGWGVVRGKVISIGANWAGDNINKCARLCNEARPFGIVVDRDDFPELPSNARFVPQVRRLAGLNNDISAWVTGEIASQFIPRERLRETPEVHVAGTCIRLVDGQVQLLVARRSSTRKLYPNLLEGCGGQLRSSESFEDGVRRHFSFELGIDVDVLDYHSFYEIREPGIPLIPGIRFLCLKRGDETPRSDHHSEVRWLSEREFRNTPRNEFVGELKAEVLALLDRYLQDR